MLAAGWSIEPRGRHSKLPTRSVAHSGVSRIPSTDHWAGRALYRGALVLRHGNMTRPTCSAVSSGLWNRGLRAIIHIYICRAPTRWQLPPFRHNSHLHTHTQVARTGCLDCTLRSPRPCNPNAALLDLFLFLSLFLFPIPGDRCCAALTSTYPTKPRLDCARSLETPRYDS
jgi:hypothetical protein